MWRSLVIVSVAALLLSAGLGWAEAPPYEGSLSWTLEDDTGLNGTGAWATAGTSLAWKVSQSYIDEFGYVWWTYDYTLTLGGGGDTSHFILETSNPFPVKTIQNVRLGNATALWEASFLEPEEYGDEGNSNPNIPDSIFGIKWAPTSGGSWPSGDTFRIVFDCVRNPVWSDFYAKDGNVGGRWNAIWNAGFTKNDTDPNMADYPAGDESVEYHILSPDTETTQPPAPRTPELPTSALLLLTLIPAAWAGRRKRN